MEMDLKQHQTQPQRTLLQRFGSKSSLKSRESFRCVGIYTWVPPKHTHIDVFMDGCPLNVYIGAYLHMDVP